MKDKTLEALENFEESIDTLFAELSVVHPVQEEWQDVKELIKQALQVKSSKEICDMLNEKFNIEVTYNNNEFYFINTIELIAGLNCVDNLIFGVGLNSELAHEITKFFMYSDEVKR